MKRKFTAFLATIIMIIGAFGAILPSSAQFVKPRIGDLFDDGGRFSEALPTGTLTVSYDLQGGEAPLLVRTVSVLAGEKLTRPTHVPELAGKIFESWCLDASGRVAWDFDDPVYSNMTLYAKYNNGVIIRELDYGDTLTIYSDMAKHNTARESQLKNEMAARLTARFAGEPLNLSVQNMNTLVRNSLGEFPIGDHEVTFAAQKGTSAKTYRLPIRVIDGASNKIYISAKGSAADFGQTASGYFAGNTKTIGVAFDHYFDINGDVELTDFSITSPIVRGQSGLPLALLSSARQLKRFDDPILIRNNTENDIWFKPDSAGIDDTIVLFDAEGALVWGYDGANRYLIDDAHPTIEQRLSSANMTFMRDQIIPAGHYLFVIAANPSGNFYVDKLNVGSASTYDYDGRKFALVSLISHINNPVQIRVGSPTSGALLTPATYVNRLPYLHGGNAQLNGLKDEINIDREYALQNVVIYDDNDAFVMDTVIPHDDIDVAFAKMDVENQSPSAASYSADPFNAAAAGVYYARFTVFDRSDSSLTAVFYRKIVIEALVNNYSYFIQNGKVKAFLHKHDDGAGVRYNTVYSPWTSSINAVFVFSASNTKFFNSYTAECQWSTILIVKADGSIVWALDSQGPLYDSTGTLRSGSITTTGNMVANLTERLFEKLPSAQGFGDTQKLISTAGNTDSAGAGGPYYLVIYPNVGGDNYSRKYGDSLIAAFKADPAIKINIKGTGILIGQEAE